MKIGVFDSGYGGLTILEKIRHTLPQYDYLYLGDNARTPYGTRSFQVIYEYTLQAVQYLQSRGCRLIVIACNTASAKALRTIQQHDIDPNKIRVLGVIRPTVEAVVESRKSKVESQKSKDERHIGVLATPGTVSSESYVLELAKQAEQSRQTIYVTQQACPLWVPLIEAGEHRDQGADYFVQKYIESIMAKDPDIDTLILGCTHYPLLMDKIAAALQQWQNRHGQTVDIPIIAQGDIVAKKLKDYLRRHPEIDVALSQQGTCQYLTTENATRFADSASLFLQTPIVAQQVEL